jgi:hypothetical protein
MKKRTILFGGVTATLMMATYLFAAPNFREPSAAEMRAFRLSTLTDENLKELHAKAKAEVAATHANMDRMMELGAAEVQARIAECESKIDDVAYKARHYPNGCPRRSFPHEYTRPRIRSVDEAYEDMIMGGCQRKGTVWEARYAGCLP